MEIKSLEQRLHQWSQDESKFDPIDAVDLASRVRKLRSARAHRRQAIVASVVLLFTGMAFFSSTSRFGNAPEPVAVKHLSSSGSQHSFESTELAQAANDRMDELHRDIGHTRQQTELLDMELRIQQAIAKADLLVQESERRSLREKQASLWLAATFRGLGTQDNQ